VAIEIISNAPSLPDWVYLRAPTPTMHALMHHATRTLPLISATVAAERANFLPGDDLVPSQARFAIALNALAAAPVCDFCDAESMRALISKLGLSVSGVSASTDSNTPTSPQKIAGQTGRGDPSYAWSDFTARLAGRLADNLMRPSLLAAWVEHEMFALRPLADGNVRVARVLATWILFPLGSAVPRSAGPEQYRKLVSLGLESWTGWYCEQSTLAKL